MSNNTAGASRHLVRRAELIQLGSPQTIHRSQRIAEQAARDAVAHWKAGNALALLLSDSRQTMTLTPAPEATSGAG